MRVLVKLDPHFAGILWTWVGVPGARYLRVSVGLGIVVHLELFRNPEWRTFGKLDHRL